MTGQEIEVTAPAELVVYGTQNKYCESHGYDTIVAHPKPKPKISVSNNSPCKGDTVILKVNEPFSSYAWSNYSNLQSISTATSCKFWVSVIDSNGCTGTSDTVEVRFGTRPTADVVGLESVCMNTEASYEVVAQTDVIYNWNIENGEIQGNDDLNKLVVVWNSVGVGKSDCNGQR